MPNVRLKSPLFDVFVYDGQNIGLHDPVFGAVLPDTEPQFVFERQGFHPTLKMLEVREGEFVKVDDAEGFFFGRNGSWVKLEPGDRILRDLETGTIAVHSATEFQIRFEPA